VVGCEETFQKSGLPDSHVLAKDGVLGTPTL
jgi:hypothetical protein